MTYGGWAPPPSTPAPRRYATKWVWLGGLVGVGASMGLPILGAFVGSKIVPGGAGGSILFLGGLAVPLILGVLLTSQQGSPARRGFGLGLIIGWALAPIVFAGLCVLIIFGAYSVPNLAG